MGFKINVNSGGTSCKVLSWRNTVFFGFADNAREYNTRPVFEKAA